MHGYTYFDAILSDNMYILTICKSNKVVIFDLDPQRESGLFWNFSYFSSKLIFRGGVGNNSIQVCVKSATRFNCVLYFMSVYSYIFY